MSISASSEGGWRIKILQVRIANSQHMRVALLLRLLWSTIKCEFRNWIQTGTERKVKMCRVSTVFVFYERETGSPVMRVASTHQCQAQPVFFKIRPSFGVAILSFSFFFFLRIENKIKQKSSCLAIFFKQYPFV